MADILDRDPGFCSGGDEDDMEVEDGIHSPTDASEDSVDVKVQAISLRNRNKRKCAEPRKLDTELPAKKRKIDLSVTKREVEQSVRSPFRPWSASPPIHRDETLIFCTQSTRLPLRNDFSTQTIDLPQLNNYSVISVPRLPSPPHYSGSSLSHPQDLIKLYPLPRTRSYSPHQQEQPLSLVSKKKGGDTSEKLSLHSEDLNQEKPIFGGVNVRLPVTSSKEFSQILNSKSQPVLRVSDRRSNVTNKVKFSGANKTNDDKKVKIEVKTEVSQQCDNKFRIDSLLSSVKTEGSSGATTSKSSQGGQQRNYKNMTRERRIEANARERTRVHTISAAFDTLRHSIPAYSHNQKLSKLSVLRIACSYIMTLSRLAGYDYSKDQVEPDLSSCVENVSKTIQTEGKIRKKKED